MSVAERTEFEEPAAEVVRAPAQLDTFMGMRITPLTQRRIDTFKKNRRGVGPFGFSQPCLSSACLRNFSPMTGADH